MFVLLLMGAPGSGKGTQAIFLSEKLGIPTISTGEILRKELESASPLGEEIRSFLDSGNLVPDEIIVNVVNKRLKENDCNSGFILDGYPRTFNQALALDTFLEGLSLAINRVISLEVPDQELIERILNRSKESARTDDNEIIIKRRLKLFHEETKKTIDYYANKKIVSFVDGCLEVNKVRDIILEMF